MASIFTHAALPALGIQFFKKHSWKLTGLSILTAIIPDADVALMKFVSYASVWGHRGFTHGLLFGLIWSTLLAFIFFRKEPRKKILWLGIWFFIIHLSHSVLDSMTNGGLGVGYFSPFSANRYFFSWRPLIVSPLEVKAFFSSWGVKILLSELVVIILPIGFFSLFVQKLRRRITISRRQYFTLSTLIILELVGIYVLGSIDQHGSIFRLDNQKTTLRDIAAGQVSSNGLGALPENYYSQAIFTNINEFRKHGFLERKVMVKPDKRGWGSPFFPNWYGGIAGRWQDSNTTLVLRTLFGFKTLSRIEAIALLEHPKQNFDLLYRLSPAEKYDLAMGDYDFHASKDIMKITHNRKDIAKDYYGICNGVAFASLNLPEPIHRVKVINPQGYEIEFHPNDIKALLAQAYYSVRGWRGINGGCGVKLSCNINPALFITTILNSIALHNRPLVIDVHPGYRAQFYPLIGFNLSIERYLNKEEVKNAFQLLPSQKNQKIALVKIRVIMNSTIMSNQEISDLSYDTENRRYAKVGVREVTREYRAYIGFNEKGDIRSGEWINNGGFYPDMLAFSLDNTADLVYGKQLLTNKYLRWDIIDGLYVRSLSGQDWNIGDFVTDSTRNYWVHGKKCLEYSAQWKLKLQYDMSRATATAPNGLPAQCFQ